MSYHRYLNLDINVEVGFSHDFVPATYCKREKDDNCLSIHVNSCLIFYIILPLFISIQEVARDAKQKAPLSPDDSEDSPMVQVRVSISLHSFLSISLKKLFELACPGSLR